MCRTLKSEVFADIKSRFAMTKQCLPNGLRALNSALSCLGSTATCITEFTVFAIEGDSGL